MSSSSVKKSATKWSRVILHCADHVTHNQGQGHRKRHKKVGAYGVWTTNLTLKGSSYRVVNLIFCGVWTHGRYARIRVKRLRVMSDAKASRTNEWTDNYRHIRLFTQIHTLGKWITLWVPRNTLSNRPYIDLCTYTEHALSRPSENVLGLGAI